MSSASDADCTIEGEQKVIRQQFRKAVHPISGMAMGLHERFTVCTFKTAAQVSDCVFQTVEHQVGPGLAERSRRVRRVAALTTLSFWNCAENKIAEPVWMSDSRVIRSTIPRRIHAEIAVRGRRRFWPALVPVSVI